MSDVAAETPAAVAETPAAVAETPAAVAEYSDFVIPTDMQVLDSTLLDSYKNTAKEVGLTQEQAQKFLDMGAESARKQAQAAFDKIEATKEEWANRAMTDKEIGGDNFKANMTIAGRAVDKFATPELKNLMDQTGLGNHPDMIRVFYQLGKLIKEDSFVAGGNTAPAPDSFAKRMFPNMN